MEQLKFFKMNKFGLSQKMKLFLGIIFIFPFIVLLWVVLEDDIVNPKSSEEIFLTMRKKIECQGVVDSIYRQKMNNNQLTLLTKECDFIVESSWTMKFIVGDSISKKEGELFLEHYRKGELIEVFDYREIAKEMKDDDWDIIKKRLKEKLNIVKDKEH